jgi:hypothetical protein
MDGHSDSEGEGEEDELVVFDEATLPVVNSEGIDLETGEPVLADAEGGGLRPGDVITMLDSLPVKRTDTLASVAQRLLHRTMRKGAWVTVARPIGRIPKHGGAGPTPTPTPTAAAAGPGPGGPVAAVPPMPPATQGSSGSAAAQAVRRARMDAAAATAASGTASGGGGGGGGEGGRWPTQPSDVASAAAAAAAAATAAAAAVVAGGRWAPQGEEEGQEEGDGHGYYHGEPEGSEGEGEGEGDDGFAAAGARGHRSPAPLAPASQQQVAAASTGGGGGVADSVLHWGDGSDDDALPLPGDE